MVRLAQEYVSGSGRRVRRENLHVTLVFLGAVDGARRACVEAAADSVRGQSFILELDRITWWPRPRVLCAGPSRIPSALLDLVGKLKRGCQGCGFEPERRPYRAHLTLARKVASGQRSTTVEAQAWKVREFSLVESRTLTTGAEYSVLRTWPLG